MYNTDTIYLHDYWDIHVEYHSTNTGKIIINIPGADGSVNGYKDKYRNLGNYIQKENIASFVRIPNDRPQEFINTGRCIINYCLEGSETICGSHKPEIWLMGFSAGGASALLTAWEYPEVTKVLAINPFLNLEVIKQDLKKYLPLYKGDLFVVIGDKDTVIDPDTAGLIKASGKEVRNIRFNVIPNCDHQLKGEDNIHILSQLPKYFFQDEYKKEPLPAKGEGVDLLND